MDNTFIISDYSERMKHTVDSLGIPESNLISNVRLDSEREYHDWITRQFTINEIDKIIIPLSLPTDASIINTDGLVLALHIRLNYEIDVRERLIPIIILSDFTIDKIIEKCSFDSDSNPQNLIFTKGIYFSSFDSIEIIDVVGNAIQCDESQYQSHVLSKLNILRKAKSGGHDIANAWGCFKLSLVAGLRDEIFNLKPISKHLKQLYAKFLICKNEAFSFEKKIDYKPIECSNKNILFIDDKSNEGWGDLMKNIFKGAGDNFVCVDSSKYKADDEHKSFKDFDGYYKECQSYVGKDWDLIIIDLRLNPDKEDIDNEMISPTEFSGYKLIDEFLNENKGYQIIISTASNKIWNINASLTRGVFSYYIKESPEFNYSVEETKINFETLKKDIAKCFDKSYLSNNFKKGRIITNIKLQSNRADDSRMKEMKAKIRQKLTTAFIFSKSCETLEFALFDYIQIVEVYCNYFTFYDRELKAAFVYENLNDLRLKQNAQFIYEVECEKIKSRYEYEKGFYDFQKSKRIGRDEQFKNYKKQDAVYEFDSRFFSFSLKLASILDVHINNIDQIEKYMELIYIRNNKIAHTGNFDTNLRIIDKNDITIMFDLVYKLLTEKM